MPDVFVVSLRVTLYLAKGVCTQQWALLLYLGIATLGLGDETSPHIAFEM